MPSLTRCATIAHPSGCIVYFYLASLANGLVDRLEYYSTHDYSQESPTDVRYQQWPSSFLISARAGTSRSNSRILCNIIRYDEFGKKRFKCSINSAWGGGHSKGLGARAACFDVPRYVHCFFVSARIALCHVLFGGAMKKRSRGVTMLSCSETNIQLIPLYFVSFDHCCSPAEFESVVVDAIMIWFSRSITRCATITLPVSSSSPRTKSSWTSWLIL